MVPPLSPLSSFFSERLRQASMQLISSDCRSNTTETAKDAQLQLGRAKGEGSGPCNCAVQLCLVPFDKTDPARRVSGRGGGESEATRVSPTQRPVSPPLPPVLSLSLSAFSCFRFGFLRVSLDSAFCFPVENIFHFGKSSRIGDQDGRRDNGAYSVRIVTKQATEFNAHTEC